MLPATQSVLTACSNEKCMPKYSELDNEAGQ